MRTLLVGNYIDDSIKIIRGLPSSNPAGSNRMKNIAGAMAINNQSTIILSSGSAANINFNKKIIHKAQITRVGTNIIFYSPALSIPFLSVFFEQISMIFIFFKLFRKYKFDIIILYCYYPSTISLGLLGKLFNVKIVEDLQDLARPKWNDLFKHGLNFALQQNLGFVLMLISKIISDIILIPTNNFKSTLFKNKFLKIDGCFDITEINSIKNFENNNKILFSGLINDENGRNLFLDTLSILNQKSNISTEFHISGIVDDENDFIRKINLFKNLNIKFHGYLTKYKYQELLSTISICLVLQNPDGRNNMAKTPSKGFEYLNLGKVVICTQIGDFYEIPNECILFLDQYNPESLVSILLKLPKIDCKSIMTNANMYSRMNWEFSVVQKNIISKLYYN